jgi:hypothetical protein
MSELNGFSVSLLVRVFLFPALLMLTAGVQAQSGMATVDANASVYENQPDANGGIYGEICFGNHATTATRRAFVSFTLPAIPEGAVITRVVYNLTQLRARGNCPSCPKTANIELRRVLENWEEGLGGTNNAACGGGTNVPGVDWNSAPAAQAGVSATEFMPSTFNAPITIDTNVGDDDDGLIADVQAWVDNPASNFGWDYRVLEEDIADNARLVNPGTVTIHWTLPPTPSILVAKTGMFDPGPNGETNPGDLINYTITVTNDGEAALTSIAVSDPLIPVISCPSGNPIPNLAPAAMEVCTGSYAITQDDIDVGQVDNTATAVAQCAAGCPVMDSGSHSEPIPPPPLDFFDGFESQ